MTPVKQEFRHDPSAGVFGDCYRAAVASVLDLPMDEVPHFARGGDDRERFRDEVEKFLRARGLAEYSLPMKDVLTRILNATGEMSPEAYWLLTGTSKTGCHHTVVCKGGHIVHDPSQTDAGVVAPCSDGFYWVTVLTMGTPSREIV